MTWRAPACAAVLIGVVVGAYFIVHWYAYSTYYLGNDAGVVAVYQGQPSGVLWFKPVIFIDTSYSVSTLLPGDRVQINQTISEPTLSAALHYSDYLCSKSGTKCVVSASSDDHDDVDHDHDAEGRLIRVSTTRHPRHHHPAALRGRRDAGSQHPVLQGTGARREFDEPAQ